MSGILSDENMLKGPEAVARWPEGPRATRSVQSGGRRQETEGDTGAGADARGQALLHLTVTRGGLDLSAPWKRPPKQAGRTWGSPQARGGRSHTPGLRWL